MTATPISFVPNIIHTPHRHVFYGHFGSFASKIFFWLERLFAAITDCLVALTNGELQAYIDFSVYPKEKLFEIHSGGDIK